MWEKKAQCHIQEFRVCLGSVGRQGSLLASREGGQFGLQETHSGCRLEKAATATFPRDRVQGQGVVGIGKFQACVGLLVSRTPRGPQRVGVWGARRGTDQSVLP